MEVARKTTRIHYMELCPLCFGYLILALNTFSTGPMFKREIAFSSPPKTTKMIKWLTPSAGWCK